jgi:hypothetical protein
VSFAYAIKIYDCCNRVPTSLPRAAGCRRAAQNGKDDFRSKGGPGLIEAAANLKEQAGELPPAISVNPPDVQKEE